MLKAIIFDMDGVLVDSEPVHMKAFEVLIKSLGKKFDKNYYYQFIGSTTDHMWDKVIEDNKLSFDKSQLMEMSDRFVAQILGDAGYPVMSGAADLIKRLKTDNIKLAIASSSGIDRIDNTLKKMGVFDEFDARVSGIDVKNPKPAPDTFLAAAEKLNVDPSECLVIEDSLNGIKAAKNACMVCVMFENDNGMPHLDSSLADYVITGYEDLDLGFFEMVYSHQKNQP